MRTKLQAIGGILAALCAAPVAADSCSGYRFEGTPITACLVDPAAEDLRLFLNDADGVPYGGFDQVNAALERQGLTLGVAMNGGMYHEDRAPVGHYVEDGVETVGVMTAEGPGNFGLLPNGVFCLSGGVARVVESRAFAAERPPCDYATQSGPMLVIGGDLHPRFLADSDSRKVRNGVGVRADGTVVMAKSEAALNFHRFARFFRDEMDTPNALFLDGSISRFYSRELGRNDFGVRMGPILGTVVPAE